jgi:hypothetical protein
MFVLLLFLLSVLGLIPDGMLGTLLLARNVLPLLPRDGTHIPIHCLPRIYNIN